jgi:tRNA(Ile2)-agmatinylcytidine synthase
VDKLHSYGVKFIDYPNLVRLNPNVPWKTRGNGALCLRFRCEDDQVDRIREAALGIVEKNSDMDHARTEPGVVFFYGEILPDDLTSFAREAIQGIVKLGEALKLVKRWKAEAVGFKTGRGIVGALAAVGATLTEDYTYELITYRVPANRGRPRQLDAASVFEMDEKTRPSTFNNLDPEIRRVLITPHGPDPILYGIRGETAGAVKAAHKLVRALETVERWTIFRTNHGTDAHLRKIASIQQVRAYNPVIVKGRVSRVPWIIPRRHVLFTIEDDTGKIDCAAYEPTGELQKAARQLIVGDVIEAHGGVRPPTTNRPLTINLEKIDVHDLAPQLVFRNPICRECGKRMESMGKGQGFRCPKCGFRSSKITKLRVEQERGLTERLYVTSSRSQRHLTKPLCRYGLEKSVNPHSMIKEWFSVNKSL